MIKNKFSFKPLSLKDLPLIHLWFNLPHVQKFYSLRQWTEKQVLEKFTPYISGNKPVLGFIISINEQAIAYIQQYKISDYPWPNQNLPQEIIDHAAGIDLFIGNTELIGKGVGKQIISKFLEQKIWPQFQYCLVDPDIKNIAAIKCYQKLNFNSYIIINSENELNQAIKLNLMILKKH